jgi:hypothetical protein
MLEDKYSMEGARDANGGPPQWRAYQAWTAGSAHGTDIIGRIKMLCNSQQSHRDLGTRLTSLMQ